jgi:hypothetical protein
MSVQLETEVAPLSLGDPLARQSHLFFKFPGKIHPPLVASILAKHSDFTTVADPMVGSGTVAAESLAAGKKGLFMDIDPLACLITRAKVGPIDPSRLRELVMNILQEAQPFPGPSKCTDKQLEAAVEHLEKETRFRAPPNVLHWFKPYVAFALCHVLLTASSVLRSSSTREQDAVLSVIASAIRRVSNADPSPVSGLEVTKIRRQRLDAGLTFDVQKSILERMEVLEASYGDLLDLDELGSAIVVNGDVREWSSVCDKLGVAPELVICSPPYCHAIEYWRRHRLEYYWLGLIQDNGVSDLKYRFVGTTRLRVESSDVQEISGSIDRLVQRIEEKDAGTSGRLIHQYFSDIRSWLSECYTSMNENGILYVIVGSCRVRGVSVDLPTLINELAIDVGYKPGKTRSYQLVNKSMQFPTRNNSGIKAETVLELQR